MGFSAENTSDFVQTSGENPQWLASNVTVTKGEHVPGITKTVKNPMVEVNEPTVNWTITSHNNGNAPLKNYTIEDTVEAPFKIRGEVKYAMYNNSSAAGKNDSTKCYMKAGRPGNETLFKIEESGEENKLKITYPQYENSDATADLIINGDYVEISVTNYIPDYDSRISTKLKVKISTDEKGKETLSIVFEDPSWAITEDSHSILELSTTAAAGVQPGMYINNSMLLPANKNYNANAVTQGKNIVDEYGKNVGVTSSAPVTLYQGSPTASFKEITEVGNPENTAKSDDFDNNYISLSDKSKEFTYTLTVNNVNTSPMEQLVIIDNLPYVGDHSTIRNDLDRDSEFEVSFADEPNVQVLKKSNNGGADYTLLDSGDYIIQYSDKQDGFVNDDWQGNGDGWYNEKKASSRSIRMIINKANVVSAESLVQLKFNAKITGDAKPAQIAWNSFGYQYMIGGISMTAAPLNVGVQIPGVPYLEKSIVSSGKNASAAAKDETFKFIIYEGDPLDITDYSVATVGKLLNDNSKKFTYAELKVKSGESVSERFMLENAVVYEFKDGVFNETVNPWTWTDNTKYNVVELDFDSKYTYKSTNDISERNYSFTYTYDKNISLEYTNAKTAWSIAVIKTDEASQPLEGAVFGLYTQNKSKALTVDDIEKLGIDAGFAEKSVDGKTYYLMSVKTSPSSGRISWEELTEDEYAILEIIYPGGYHGNGDIKVVKREEADAGTDTAEVSVINYENTPLPETGGSGLRERLKELGILSYLCAGVYVIARFFKKQTY